MMNIVEDLDFAEYVDPAHNPMIPRIVVLKPGLVIYKIYNGYWFFDRPTMADLRQDLRAVTRNVGPTSTSQRPNPKRHGGKELLYPYGKTYNQSLGEQD